MSYQHLFPLLNWLCVLVRPYAQVIDVNVGKMLCNVDCENDDAHDAFDNELEYLITDDEEDA